MEARHLELLRELSVRGSLTAVAAATHRTASALSQQLRTAERELGVRLVEPNSRGIRLTSQGQLLADGADEALAGLARLQAQLDESIGTPIGTVSIVTLPSAGEALLPALVTRLRDSRITLTIDDYDLAEADYAARTLDADIVIAHSLAGDVPAGAEHLQHRVLAREPIDVCLPADHPLAKRRMLRPRDLIGATWIGVPIGYPFDTIHLAIAATTGEPLQLRQRLRDNRLVQALVAHGEGVALLPRFTTPRQPGTVLVPLQGVPAVRRIVALARHDRMVRLSVRAVLEELTQIGDRITRESGTPEASE